MKRKIYGVFSNLDDAKSAVGSIKKVSFNRTNLTVVFSGDDRGGQHQPGIDFEFSSEFLPAGGREKAVPPLRGVKEENLPGVGKVQIAANIVQNFTDNDQPASMGLTGRDLGVVERMVKDDKVLAIVEADADLLPKLRFILESNGAEVITEPL
ncbi:MAG: hypothetical protein ACM3X9_08150 [Bacillota bacterium]